MNNKFPPQEVPATPEYVLSVIADNHRQQSQFDPEVDRDTVLTFDTTVARWREACDLLSWTRLAHALNSAWSVNFSDDEWKAVLHPPRQRTLLDVCTLIASRANRPVIRAITMLGKPCNTAGAFLTVRHFLSQAGADASQIGPSTELSPFLRTYLGEFLGPISRLAPGRLPPVAIRTSFYHSAVVGFAISLLFVLVTALVGRPECTALATMFAIVFYPLIWIAARRRPEDVQFGELKTFRDLAYLLTDTSA
jgi:hypothetical protein